MWFFPTMQAKAGGNNFQMRYVSIDNEDPTNFGFYKFT